MSEATEQEERIGKTAELSQRRTVSRSEISFPYVNMEDAVELARAMQQAGGVPMSRDQLADQLGVNANLSTFQNKIGAARQFGLISAKEGKLFLQDTGHRIVSDDEHEVRIAKRDAFLNVELYRRLFEHFRGKTLPPLGGIESAIKSFGVSEKQTDKARQAFEKSAAFSGFLNTSKDRLVEPLIVPRQEVPVREAVQEIIPAPKQMFSQQILHNSDILALDEPMIHGILAKLPEPGSDWGIRERVKWLKTLIHIFGTVYTDTQHSEHEIQLKIVNLLEDMA